MNQQNVRGLGYGLGVTVAFLLLCTSAAQVKQFFGDSIQDPLQQAIMITGPILVLITAQLLARWITSTDHSPAVKTVWALTIVLAEMASIYTSAVSFTGNIGSAIVDQREGSFEYSTAKKTITDLDAELDVAKAERQKYLDMQWPKNAERVGHKIAALNEQRKAALTQLTLVDDGAAGKAFSSMEERTGITPWHVGIVFGVLMSLAVFSINLGLGSTDKRSAQVRAGGGLGELRPNLRAVS